MLLRPLKATLGPLLHHGRITPLLHAGMPTLPPHGFGLGWRGIGNRRSGRRLAGALREAITNEQGNILQTILADSYDHGGEANWRRIIKAPKLEFAPEGLVRMAGSSC